jgi:hypothetical protein
MSRDLPQFPNLDHLKKQAKVLLRKLKNQNPDAQLAEAQYEIAQKYGFASWARLKAYVEATPHPENAEQPEVPAPGGFARYTELARQTIFFARYRAGERGSLSIETEHLLMGVLDADGKFLDRLVRPSSSSEAIRRTVEQRTAIREKAPGFTHIPLSNESKRILRHAAEESDRLHHELISTGHFLLGLLHEEESLGASVLLEALASNEIPRDAAQDRIIQVLEKG